MDTPTHVSEVDRLQAENLQLKMTLLATKEMTLLHELSSLRERRAELQVRYDNLRKQLEETYAIDLSKVEIRAEDGRLVPAGSTSQRNIG